MNVRARLAKLEAARVPTEAVAPCVTVACPSCGAPAPLRAWGAHTRPLFWPGAPRTCGIGVCEDADCGLYFLNDVMWEYLASRADLADTLALFRDAHSGAVAALPPEWAA